MKNPAAVAFESPDHAKLTGYEVDIVSAANAVVQTVTTGKGTQDTAGVVTLPFPVQQLAFGLYTVRVRAVATVAGAQVKSADSAPSDVFERAPSQPIKVTIR